MLQRFADEHGYTNTKILVDDGYTGTNFNRPGVQEGFELVKQGLVGCWIVDEEAAAVVRHIFDLSIAGKGPTQIARILEQENAFPT